jgi:hypothetical protein
MNRKHVFVSGAVVTLLLAATVQGCSSDSGDGGSSPGGSSAGSAGTGGGSAGSGSGGTDSGTGGMASGGSSGTGGSAGTGGASSGTGGASSGTGGATAAGPCGSGITNGQTACAASCSGSICGLSDLGSRDCNCVSGIYQCASCEFSGGEPILDPPAAELPACAEAEATLKGSTCTTAENGERCQPTDATRVCACWNAEWDCDKKPW